MSYGISTKTKVLLRVSAVLMLPISFILHYLLKQPLDLHNCVSYLEVAVFFATIFCSMRLIELSLPKFIKERTENGYHSKKNNSAALSKCRLVANVSAWCGIAVICMMVFGYIVNSDVFTSKSRYEAVSQMVTIVSDTDEGSAFPNLLGSNNDTDNLPLLGQPEGIKNAETQMGRQPSLGSQFELLSEELTSQNIGNSLMYVIPLEPKNFIKWDGNNHGYFTIDRNNGTTEFIQEGLSTTERAPFGDNAIRIIYKYMRKNGIKGRITELSPEVTEDGVFNYVATVYETDGIEGFKRVTGVVELNAVTKECHYYDLDEVPEYVDRVFPEDFFHEYIKYYGGYKNGILNYTFTQREVLEPTAGSDIVYIDGVCYYYTGFTSAGKGESSNGIIMMNCRTGEMKYYKTYGISESKAMGVAEGRVQEKGYKASYPLLLMVGGQETYFMLMRDANENLCGYAFVSYKDYSKATVADTLITAQTQYMKEISATTSADILDNLELSSGTAAIRYIGNEVKNGDTIWYVTLDGNNHIFTLTSDVEPLIVFAEEGNMATVEYVESDSQVVSAVSFKVTLVDRD